MHQQLHWCKVKFRSYQYARDHNTTVCPEKKYPLLWWQIVKYLVNTNESYWYQWELILPSFKWYPSHGANVMDDRVFLTNVSRGEIEWNQVNTVPPSAMRRELLKKRQLSLSNPSIYSNLCLLPAKLWVWSLDTVRVPLWAKFTWFHSFHARWVWTITCSEWILPLLIDFIISQWFVMTSQWLWYNLTEERISS